MFMFIFLFCISSSLMIYGQGTIAIGVYGQGGSFTTNTINKGGLSASSLQAGIGLAFDGAGNLYVTDAGNNRVLFYLKGSTTATRVYGQGGSFTSNTANNGGITADSLSGPTDIIVDSVNGIYIADRQNHRVLYYVSGSTTATKVYGQGGSFTSNTVNNGGLNANSLNNPSAVVLDNSGNLYIADASNNRVLYYVSGSTTATGVYGQGGSFTTATQTPITANSLNGPFGLTLDSSNNLYVADGGNSRILFYASGSTTATRVYGQYGSFTSGDFSNPGGVSANSMSRPRGVLVYTNYVYVTDTENFRALRFTGASTTADQVFGQPDFTTNIVNNGGVSAASLNVPYRIAKDLDGNLYVTDGANNRILVYPSPFSGGTGSGECFHTSTKITYKGKIYTYNELKKRKESECIVPHTIRAKGVEILSKCGSGNIIKLILTSDHLVATSTGYKRAISLNSEDTVYFEEGIQKERCMIVSVYKKNVEESFFGLNCLTSEVIANGILTSTFGKWHLVPKLWMKVIGNMVGIERASAWGDRLAALLYKTGI